MRGVGVRVGVQILKGWCRHLCFWSSWESANWHTPYKPWKKAIKPNLSNIECRLILKKKTRNEDSQAFYPFLQSGRMGAFFFIFSLFINIGFLSCIKLSFSVVTLFPFKFSLSNFLQSGGREGGGAPPGGQYRGRRRSCMTLPFLVHTHPSTYLADSLNNNNNNYFCYSHISWFVNLYLRPSFS